MAVKSWATVAVLAYVLALASSQCLTKNDKREETDSDVKEAFLKGQQIFSLDMLRTLVVGPNASTIPPPLSFGTYLNTSEQWFETSDDATPQNVFFSPYSIYYALLLTYFGAADGSTTAHALRKALHIDDGEGRRGDKLTALQSFKIEKMLRAEMTEYQGMNNSSENEEKQGMGYELSVSNRLYFDKNEDVRPCIEKILADEIRRLDFERAPEEARTEINDWVEKETKGHIKNLIPEDGITSDTNLVVVNAAYFKGLWNSPFSPELTKKEVFYESRSRQTLVDMMHQKGNFNYLSSKRLGAEVLELPYLGKNASLVILLPPFALSDGLERTVALLNVDALREVLDSELSLAHPLDVALPKFTIEKSIDLLPSLTNLGLGSLFDSKADFSEFVGENDLNNREAPRNSTRRPIAIDTAIHRARVDVDETGTEAAAASGFFSIRIDVEPVSVIANHPFVFLIYDRIAQSILFAGVYRSPRG